VEVQHERLIHLVLHEEAHTIAGVHGDQWPGHLPVERHRIDELAGRDLPLHLGDGQVEDLDVAVHLGLERLVADALGVRAIGELRDEVVHPLGVGVGHLLGGHGGRCATGVGRSAPVSDTMSIPFMPASA
jgi:hypothetical protein